MRATFTSWYSFSFNQQIEHLTGSRVRSTLAAGAGAAAAAGLAGAAAFPLQFPILYFCSWLMLVCDDRTDASAAFYFLFFTINVNVLDPGEGFVATGTTRGAISLASDPPYL